MGRPGPTSQPGPKGDKVMFLLFLYFSAYHRQSARISGFYMQCIVSGSAH